MQIRTLGSLILETYYSFSEDKGNRMAAALAYYTIFSIAPLLLITIATVSLVIGPKAATQQVHTQLQGLMGDAGAAAVQSILQASNRPATGTLAVAIGFAVLLFGASGVFGELQEALNTIWKVAPPKTGGLWLTIKARFLSFAMVLGIGFLLLVSLVISAALTILGNFVHGFLPQWQFMASVFNALFSIGMISLLFAMIFKILPDTPIAWSDVTLGSVVSAILFTIGKAALGWYLGWSAVTSSYGAAGALVVVLLWTYYSAMLLLYGAEFTAVYSRWEHRSADNAKAGVLPR